MLIVQVWLGVIIPAQGAHHKETAPGAIVFQKEASMLEYLEAQSWRGPVQGNQIHRLAKRILQESTDLQRAREQLLRRQPILEKHSHIHVTQGMGLLPCLGPKQVRGDQIRPTLQQFA
jgi:hypothetical protein